MKPAVDVYSEARYVVNMIRYLASGSVDTTLRL